MMELDMWLKTECNIQTVVLTLTTTKTQWLPRDPQRFFMTLPWSATVNVFSFWGQSAPTGNGLQQSVGSPWVDMTRNEMGDMICEPYWSWCFSGTTSYTIQVASYNPKRKELYDECIRRYLSQLSS